MGKGQVSYCAASVSLVTWPFPESRGCFWNTQGMGQGVTWGRSALGVTKDDKDSDSEQRWGWLQWPQGVRLLLG